jgi:hypothetical protein
MEDIKEKLLEKLREDTSNEEFMVFAFEWLGEEYIMELLKESIEGYDDLEVLENSLKGLERGDYKIARDKY